jgi:hypothetical protein
MRKLLVFALYFVRLPLLGPHPGSRLSDEPMIISRLPHAAAQRHRCIIEQDTKSAQQNNFFPFLPPAHLEKPNQETVSLAPPTSTKPKTATTNPKPKPKPKEKKNKPNQPQCQKKNSWVGWQLIQTNRGRNFPRQLLQISQQQQDKTNNNNNKHTNYFSIGTSP